ncbi:MAG: carbohydrate ABC transporter permease [Acidobacteriota bacterium]
MSRRLGRKVDRVGYWMSLPYVLHFLVFMAYPLIFAFVLVFHKWNIYTPMKWVGLGNVRFLLQDGWVWKALFNTLYFILIHIPSQLVVALGLAQLLNRNLRGRSFFRAAYFMPVVVSGVVVTILWQQLYGQDTGLINAALGTLGLPKVPWLTDYRLAMPSIALMATWKNVGFYVVLFLVGLQTVPRSLYEAAELDGASGWQQFFRITIPMLNPTILLVLILSTIGGFSLFIEPYIMTGGGPAGSTLSGVLYLYKQAFFFNRMGYAATIGFFWALMILTVVVLQRKLVEQDIE